MAEKPKSDGRKAKTRIIQVSLDPANHRKVSKFPKQVKGRIVNKALADFFRKPGSLNLKELGSSK